MSCHCGLAPQTVYISYLLEKTAVSEAHLHLINPYLYVCALRGAVGGTLSISVGCMSVLKVCLCRIELTEGRQTAECTQWAS